ncbi:MAG: TonB-dependent receptor [Pseudomonadales bacterium]
MTYSIKTMLFVAGAAALAALTSFASAEGLVLEEVIVTAEKREESLQDVPISIAAFDDEALERLGIDDLKDIAANIPNVNVQEFTGSSTTVRLFMRGVGQNDVQVTQDPSVALYMDGVYIGSSVGTAFESADIRRIEVLRGPQGTLYGRNATGGAINLITKQANPEALTFKQSLSGGNYGLLKSRTILNVPVSEAAAVKLAYSRSERDGVFENSGAGEDWGIEDRQNLTFDFHWALNDSNALDYKYEQSTIEDTSRLSQVLDFDSTAPNAAITTFENPAMDAAGNPIEATEDRLDEASSFDEIEFGDVEIDAHTLTYAWEINDSLTFKSITAYRDVEANSQMAQSPTTSLLGNFSIVNGLPMSNFEQITQEFQLLGYTESLQWVGGLFYYKDESEEDASRSQSNGSEALAPGVLVDFTETENESIALFGQATWTPPALGGRWQITVGARYSQDNRKAFRDNNRPSFGFAGGATAIEPFTDNYDKDFSKFNPSFTVEYDLNDASNLYAKVVTAYKSGGTSQRSTNSVAFREGFDEEDLTSYEFGYKGDLADGRVRLNAALFYMDYEGYQQSLPTGRTAGERDFVNIEDATISGVEVDITVAITSELTSSLAYGYLDTNFGPETVVFTQVDDASPTGLTEVTETLTGDIAFAAEESATVSLNYAKPLAFGLLSASASYQYQESAFGGVIVPAGELDERRLLGATLGVSEIALGSAGQLKILLWGKNLLDEEYFVGNVTQPSFFTLGLNGLATFGDPRTYGLTIEYDYF